jgi:uncharacterized SAM-binding protein YcdF (DUF218 family)
MLLLRKFFSRFLFPIPLCLELLSLGLLLLCFTRKQRAGKTLVALAAVLLFLFSNHTFSGLLLAPLENRYPPLFISPGAPVPAGLRGAKFIVVLGSGFRPDAGRPIEMQLDDGSIARLVEGVRVSKVLHCCKLVLSGGPVAGSASSTAGVMAQLAEELGVSRQDLILEEQSKDTEGEARLVAPIVAKQPFILVTEASHMPRALALFKKQGTHPIADPMDFRISHAQARAPQELFPDAEELRVSQRAVYEYLGLAWEKIRGEI